MKKLCEPTEGNRPETNTKVTVADDTPLRTHLRETTDGYVIELEIPRDALADVDVSIENGRLVIRYPKT